MSNLTILLLTYQRTEYAVKTLKSTLKNLEWDGKLQVHIADDGSAKQHVDTLADIVTSSGLRVTISNAERGGYGKNYNLALQQVHQWADYVLPLEDDWELIKPLDCNLLERVVGHKDKNVGCVRLGYIGYTQQLKGTFIYYEGMHWLRLDSDSIETHVFAGHPRFESVEWQRSVGPWPEGLAPGATEVAVANIQNARYGVVWPCELVRPSGDMFAHIGTIRSTEV